MSLKRGNASPGTKKGTKAARSGAAAETFLSRRSAAIRNALAALKEAGEELGGLREATRERNEKRHQEALEAVRPYWAILRLHRVMSLSQLGRELYEAGLATKRGRPYGPSMVRRVIERFRELTTPYDWADHIDEAIATRNSLGLQLYYQVAVQGLGPIRDSDLLAPWLRGGEDELWIRECLSELGLGLSSHNFRGEAHH